ncbi:hypothetical protein BRAO375_4020026 [Bradyrhizobium sp. ORS 375]|nr:hypothetical protein BRAO375_4020026 [Bradyrhizobium sp. ORS 375]
MRRKGAQALVVVLQTQESPEPAIRAKWGCARARGVLIGFDTQKRLISVGLSRRHRRPVRCNRLRGKQRRLALPSTPGSSIVLGEALAADQTAEQVIVRTGIFKSAAE